MEFRILGPLEVVEEGRSVAVERRLSRALLAYLLLHANEPVSADRLVDELWGPAAPRTATASLRNYVSTLRKLLGGERIELEPAGYVLRVDPERFDLTRFDRLVGEARTAPPRERSQLLRSALALWRGPPLEDLAFEEFAQAEIAELRERYVDAVEERVDADLQLGAGAGLVEELAELISEHPLRERLRWQLMLALYRAGRQADALQAYQDARRILDEELGLEPSEEVRELQQRILRHDPALQEAAAAPEPSESRRTVTILFCDFVGSTRLATTLDPEAYRQLMSSYFDAASRPIEAHGGVAEKFIGDAVMAVFGAPELHEDDALRAVRAAVDARDAVTALEAHDLAVRIAVNTGEVVVSASGLVTGATVNLAVHLEQRMGVNEVVLGEQTHRLVRDAVRAKPVELGDGLRGWRLEELIADVPGVTRRLGVPLVGRKQELRMLRAAFRRARSDRSCEVVTLVGEPGIGKTRLARELATSVKDDARVLVGNCVAYGAGATYLPLATIVRDAAPEPSAAGIASLLSGADDAEHIAQLVGELIGICEGPSSPDEAFWAVRRLLEAIAREQPLVVVLDDVHWAEQTLLDLVEYLGEWAEGPLLIVCLARPDLLERRPGWGGPRSTGFVIELAPLAAEWVGVLVEELAGGPLEAGAQREIVGRAGGNPLFAEQLLAFACESPDTTLERAPPTLEALLASRLELVPLRELDLLRRASVFGRDFSPDEVRALGAAEDADLRALERRGLIHSLPAQEGYRFHHVLLRDVAYAGILKGARAELHEQAADSLDRRGGTDELVGYHLEQSVRYQAELGRPDDLLAESAAERLAAASWRARWRNDARAAASLLERALTLTRPFRFDVHLELDLASAQWTAPEGAVATAEAAAERARESGDEAGEVLAQVVAATFRASFAEDPDVQGLKRLARSILRLLERRSDHAGLFHVWSALAEVASFRCRYEEFAHAREQMFQHARRAGHGPQSASDLDPTALVCGPWPTDEALRLLVEDLPKTDAPFPSLCRALLLAMLGRFDEAWPLAEDASGRYRELTGTEWGSDALALIARLAGDEEASVAYLRTLCRWLEERGDWAHLSAYAPLLGRSLCALGRFDEAEHLAKLGREVGSEHDVETQMLWRQVKARVLASRDEHAQAEQLARDSVAIGEQSDDLNLQGDALCELAEVLLEGGRTEDAAAALEQALKRYERKRNLVMANRARARIDELRLGAAQPG